MIDLLFGTHLGGWEAMVQFWFWTITMFATFVFLYKKGK